MAESLTNIVSALREHWLGQGLRLQSLTRADMDAAERRLNLSVAADHRFVLEKVGVPAGQDRHGYRFWHPAEFQLPRQHSAVLGSPLPSNPAYVFADYLDESWWLVMSVPAGSANGVIVRDLGTDPSAADSAIGDLATFFEAYLRDDDVLYDPS